jgi:hypothetical protein
MDQAACLTEFLAEMVDMNIYRSIDNDLLMAPEMIQYLFSGEYPAWMRSE